LFVLVSFSGYVCYC